MRYSSIFFGLMLVSKTAVAQLADKSSFEQLHIQKAATNKTGMTILGGWAALNVVSGVAGFATAKDDEWKAFHGMNAIWGEVNIGFAGLGYWGADKEREQHLNSSEYLHKYESTKRLYLLNAGLDGLYIGTGLILCLCR